MIGKVYNDEKSFLQSFALHSEKAQKAFFETYYARFFHFAFEFSQNNSEIESILKDCFLHVFNCKGEFSSIEELKYYMYQRIREAFRGKDSLEGIEIISHNGKQIQLDLYRVRSEVVAMVEEKSSQENSGQSQNTMKI